MRMYSKSGSALNSLKRRSQTPAITASPEPRMHPHPGPFAELGRQIAPGRGRPRQPKHRIHKEPVVGAAPPRQPPARPGKMPPRSAPIARRSMFVCSRSPPFSILNQNSPHLGIPRMQTGPNAPIAQISSNRTDAPSQQVPPGRIEGGRHLHEVGADECRARAARRTHCSASKLVGPPTSGVPVPGAKPGSMKSMSKLT